MEGILEHCRARDRDQFMPAFPPGKLLHIEVEKNAKPWYDAEGFFHLQFFITCSNCTLL